MTKWMTAILLVSLFYGCGPSAEKVLKRYEPYARLTAEGDKLPVSFEIIAQVPMISYSSSLINSSEGHVSALAGRWFVADALDPDVRLPAKVMLMSVNKVTVNDTVPSLSYGYSLAFDSIDAPFLLVGFEGIAPTESKAAAIPPLFFLVGNKKEKISLLTPVPRAAGDLFTTTYTPMFFSEQEYSGEVPFENSKNVVLKMTLSEDLQQVTALTLLADNISLTKKHFDQGRKWANDRFRYLENTTWTAELNSSGDITSTQLSKGGIEATDTLKTADGRIVLTENPFTCDLTVTNACIYGHVKLQLSGCGTESVHVVLKNTTTPQDIPEEVLKELQTEKSKNPTASGKGT